MTNEPRKASEVILKLEEKLDVALGLIRTLDLNIKILSNKLNSVQEALAKKADEAPKFTVEAVNNTRPPTPVFSQFQQNPVMDPEKQIPVEAEFRLPMEAEPKSPGRAAISQQNCRVIPLPANGSCPHSSAVCRDGPDSDVSTSPSIKSVTRLATE